MSLLTLLDIKKRFADLNWFSNIQIYFMWFSCDLNWFNIRIKTLSVCDIAFIPSLYCRLQFMLVAPPLMSITTLEHKLQSISQIKYNILDIQTSNK